MRDQWEGAAEGSAKQSSHENASKQSWQCTLPIEAGHRLAATTFNALCPWQASCLPSPALPLLLPLTRSASLGPALVNSASTQRGLIALSTSGWLDR